MSIQVPPDQLEKFGCGRMICTDDDILERDVTEDATGEDMMREEELEWERLNEDEEEDPFQGGEGHRFVSPDEEEVQHLLDSIVDQRLFSASTARRRGGK